MNSKDLYRCVRCGYEETDHDPNLINTDPEDPEFALVDEVLEGFSMSILECMETPRPPEYEQLIRGEHLYSGNFNRYYTGYVSGDPRAESKAREQKNRFVTYQGSIVFIQHWGGPVLDISG